MSKIIKPTIITTLLNGGHAKRVFSKGARLLPVALCFAVLVSSAIPVLGAYAATILTIDVDNTDDNNPEGGCTLREAIDVVNASLGPGPASNGCTVNMSGTGTPISYEIILPSYTYTLSGAAGDNVNTSGDLDILASYSVALNGAGAGSTIIDGGGIDRVLDLPVAGITVNITNLTIRNGHGYLGGGIRLEGSTVTISNSVVSNNESGYSGGGVHSNHTSLTIANSTISDNYANTAAGGINFTGTGMLTISFSAITSNNARSNGGGIAIGYQKSQIDVSNSTISDNYANDDAGGIYFYGAAGTLNIINSTIFGNRAGRDSGGIRTSGNTNIANSTISDNYANRNGGGILFSGTGTSNLTNVTITNNIADDDINGGDGGGIFHSSGTVNLKNSIVAGNSDRSGGRPDCSGTFNSLGHNLIGKNTGCIASFPAGNPNGNNDFVGTGPFPLDPLLGGLTGDPAYILLQLDSPAIDKIPEANCTYKSDGTNPLFTNDAPITTDQAGNTRDLNCDIGAFEVPPVGVQVLEVEMDIPDNTGEVDFGITPIGTPLTKTFTVKNIGKTTALTLSNLTVPSGFSVVSDFGSTSVATKSQTTFAVQLDATEALSYTGQLSFTNNAGNQNPFNFTISGSVVSEKLIHLPLILKNQGGVGMNNTSFSAP